jgi:hypothetical protein
MLSPNREVIPQLADAEILCSPIRRRSYHRTSIPTPCRNFLGAPREAEMGRMRHWKVFPIQHHRLYSVARSELNPQRNVECLTRLPRFLR